MTHGWTPDDGEKVSFPLTRDADGYPPADWEHLWASRLPDGLFELDNTPFFARGVSLGDVVAADERDDLNVFREVVRPSGNSTVRVVLFDPARMADLRESLRRLGCATELSHLPNLVAVDIPAEVDYAAVRRFLAAGEEQRHWEYEEASLRHPST